MNTADLLADAEALATDDENAGVVYCRTCDRLVRVVPTNAADPLHTTWECYGIGMASGHLVHCVHDDNCPHLFTCSHTC
jgi:hypothetical protein